MRQPLQMMSMRTTRQHLEADATKLTNWLTWSDTWTGLNPEITTKKGRSSGPLVW